MLELIRLSLWGNGFATANWDTYVEMKQQAIAALPAPYLGSINLPKELQQEWKSYILQQLAFYTSSIYEQSILPIDVPYVILKGTSAAKYYPNPECRIMGDIDIMTRKEDFDNALRQLQENGYQIIKTLDREVSLVKSNVVIELHRYFASLNDPAQAKYLDKLIVENINPSHVLPDPINGLVILEHISQHMEGGLGLRQIIDWMMFVDKCLPDEKWPEFNVFAAKIGLDKLAIVVTHMCEMYLGLPQRTWCADADPSLCEQLIEYVLLCGNFGSKKTSDTDISENALAYASTPQAAYKLLQKQGMTNWKAAQKHKFLQPFAWIYQALRYASKGLKRKRAVSRLKEEYIAARKRNAMFDALGIKTAAKKIANIKASNVKD